MADEVFEPGEMAPPPSAPLSWGSLARTARVCVTVVGLIAASLLVLPQMRDMLAEVSDYTADHYWPGVSYHLSLMFLAFSAWFWSRTVLAARFRVEDRDDARQAVPQMRSNSGYRIDATAFNVLPRGLFLAVSFGGLLASVKSSDWMDALAILAWSAGGYELLRRRLEIQKHFRSPPAPKGRGQTPIEPAPLGEEDSVASAEFVPEDEDLPGIEARPAEIETPIVTTI